MKVHSVRWDSETDETIFTVEEMVDHPVHEKPVLQSKEVRVPNRILKATFQRLYPGWEPPLMFD